MENQQGEFQPTIFGGEEMTKKELLESKAFQDAPDDAEIRIGSESKYGHLMLLNVDEIFRFKESNEIVIM